MMCEKADAKVLVDEIKEELKRLADLEERQKRIKWEQAHNEPSLLYGIPTGLVRRTSSKHYQRVRKCSKKQVFRLCSLLLESGIVELRTIAFDWAFRRRAQYQPEDFGLFEPWLKKYVHGWSGCDDLCMHALGAFVFQFPQFVPKVRDWAGSENKWFRRACAVVLIYSIRRRKLLREVFEVADLLLTDEDVMVQKGYGWMLKEASNRFPNEVYSYVVKSRGEMPRTALRYAIEKLPSGMKREAMKREK